MRAQAAEFFIHIGFLHKERKFLLQTAIVNIAHRLLQARAHFFQMRAEQMREKLAERIHNFFHCAQALEQVLLQFFTFARTGGGKVFQHFIEQLLHRFGKRFFIFALAREHAGKFQNIGHAELGQIFMLLAPFAVEPSQLVHQFLIHRQLAARARFQRLHLDAAFDFAARGLAGHSFAQSAFQVAQIIGHFELHVQIAVVDRADIQIDAAAAALACRIGKAGHAVDAHGV